jgi:hypothetical protein
MTEPTRATTTGDTGDRTSTERERRESAVRARTRNRMRELLVASSALGVVSCGGAVTSIDTVPSPLRCHASDIAHILPGHMVATGKWVQSESGLVMRFRVTAYGQSGRDDPLSFAGDPRLVGATLVRVRRAGDTIELDCTPNAGASNVDVSVPLSCDGVANCYLLRFTISQPSAGSLIDAVHLGLGVC